MENFTEKLAQTIVEGDVQQVTRLVKRALAAGVSADDLLHQGVFRGLEIVGQHFQDNTLFVSDMLYSSKLAKKAISLLRPQLKNQGLQSRCRVLIGTVQGDLHDIGKDLVATVLRLGGFDVVDLGVDVSAGDFLEALEKYPDTRLVCLSALLTATMSHMADTVAKLRARCADGSVKIMVGGAPVTAQFAASIGADGYSEDAVEALEVARALCFPGETA